MNRVIKTKNSKETQHIAKELAITLQGGEVICLSGELGAGKTTFTQGLATGLGIIQHINSPTFIIHRTYKIQVKNQKSKIKNLHHIDLYRIEDEKDVAGLGLEEILNQDDAVIVIEWPEKLGKLLPKKRIDIQFEYMGEKEREITISKLI